MSQRPQTKGKTPGSRKSSMALSAAAIALLLLSLPAGWMSFADGAVTMRVTGLNGYLTLPFRMPIWLVVVIAVAGAGLTALHGAGLCSLPRWVLAGPCIFSATFLLMPATAVVFSPGSIQIGFGLASVGLAAALAATLLSKRSPAGSVEPSTKTRP